MYRNKRRSDNNYKVGISMEKFKQVNYKLENNTGTVLVSENITNENEIKDICFKDYLEKLSKKIEIVKEGN